MPKNKEDDYDLIDDEEYPEYGIFPSESFDYAAFFERMRTGEGTAKDHEEFTIRAMQMFCLQVWSDKKPDKWLLNYFSNQFLRVLNGAEWCDELPLPWIPRTEIWTRAEKRGLDIFCYIENTKRANPNLKMDSLFWGAADKFKTSYETARDQYYKWKKKTKHQRQ